jgi:hypothetical protein
MISNPILQGLTVIQGAEITLAQTDPILAPIASKNFWFNFVDRNLFLAIATNSVTDWIAIGGNAVEEVAWDVVSNKPTTFPSTWDAVSNKPTNFPTDAATILNKILIEDGQVLTDENNILFEE